MQKKKILYRRITFAPRAGGKNTVNYRMIARVGAKALREFPKLNRELDKAVRISDREN